MAKEGLQKPFNLRNVERSRLRKVAREVNEVVGFIPTQSISESSRLLIAGANVVAERLGVRRGAGKRTEESWWRRRVKQKIRQLRQDISRSERMVSGDTTRKEISQNLKRKYNIDKKGCRVVLEELKGVCTSCEIETL